MQVINIRKDPEIITWREMNDQEREKRTLKILEEEVWVI